MARPKGTSRRRAKGANETQLNIARAHYAAGRRAEAAAVCERVARLQPRNLNVAQLRAQLRLDQADYFGAITCLEPLLNDAKPSALVDPFLLLARAYLGARLDSQALSLLNRVIDAAPHDAGVHHLLSDVLISRGDFDGAVHHADRAVQIAPDRIDLALALGDAQCRAGLAAPARRTFDRLTAYQSSFYATHWLAYGELAEAIGAVRDARDAYAQANRRDPEQSEALFRDGCRRYAERDYAAAAHRFRRAWRLRPDSRECMVSLVGALARLPASTPDARLEQELTVCLADERLDPNHLRAVASRQVLSKPAIRRLVAASRPGVSA